MSLAIVDMLNKSSFFNKITDYFFVFELLVTLLSCFLVLFLNTKSKLLILGMPGYELYFATVTTFILLRAFVRTLNPDDHYFFIRLITAIRVVYFVSVNSFIWYIFFSVFYGVSVVLMDVNGIIYLVKTYWTWNELGLIFDQIVEGLEISDIFSETDKDRIVISSNNPNELQEGIKAYKEKYDALKKKDLIDWQRNKQALLFIGLFVVGGTILFLIFK